MGILLSSKKPVFHSLRIDFCREMSDPKFRLTVDFRRLKKDVLNDLPMKRQEVVYLKDDSIYTNIANLRKANAAFSGASVISFSVF